MTIRPGTITNPIGLVPDAEFRGTFPTGDGVPGGVLRAVLLVGTDGTFSGLPRPVGGFFTPPNRAPRPFNGLAAPRRSRS